MSPSAPTPFETIPAAATPWPTAGFKIETTGAAAVKMLPTLWPKKEAADEIFCPMCIAPARNL